MGARAHLEAIIAILNRIEGGAERGSIFYEIGRAIGEARLALIDLPREDHAPGDRP